MTEIKCGNAVDVLRAMPAESIDCCITSPPYFNLRDYGVEGQIGLESSVEEYIQKLVDIFNEIKRVLKPNGTLWLNIGDSYNGSGKSRNADGQVGKLNSDIQSSNKGIQKGRLSKTSVAYLKPKDLIGVPWMLAFALRKEGWYLRQDIIWEKPNCMPEAVKDRCTNCTENIFLLSKSRTYYFDNEAIKEPCVGFDKSSPRGSKGALTLNAGRRKGNNKSFRGGGVYTNNRSFNNSADKSKATVGNVPNETGLRNRRNVWKISTQGCKEAHFATFPERLAELCLLAGCPENGTALDPFCGSGTVGVVSKRQNKNFIGIDINSDYCELSKRRIENARSKTD